MWLYDQRTKGVNSKCITKEPELTIDVGCTVKSNCLQRLDRILGKGLKGLLSGYWPKNLLRRSGFQFSRLLDSSCLRANPALIDVARSYFPHLTSSTPLALWEGVRRRTGNLEEPWGSLTTLVVDFPLFICFLETVFLWRRAQYIRIWAH